MLSIDPLSRSVPRLSSIHDFPLPHGSTVSVSAFANDVVTFLRDVVSLIAFHRVCSTYGRLSGARIKCGKHAVMLYRNSVPAADLGSVPVGNYVRMLRELIFFFTRAGSLVEHETYLLRRLTFKCLHFATFIFPFRDSSCFIKYEFLGKPFFVTRVELVPSVCMWDYECCNRPALLKPWVVYIQLGIRGVL